MVHDVRRLQAETGRERPLFADPFAAPAYFDGIVWRRSLAYVVDLLVLACVLAAVWVVFGLITVVSFGLLSGVWILFPLVPLAYHTLLIGGARSATLGQRLFELEVRTWSGGRPSYVQAAVQTVLFYVSVGLTSFLILVWVFFNPRRRTLHDYLSGTLVVRRLADPVVLP